jgi:hypothetical protein
MNQSINQSTLHQSTAKVHTKFCENQSTGSKGAIQTNKPKKYI